MARTLRDGGFPEAMVQAFVKALREALSQVATKEDVRQSESRVMGEIRQLESRVMGELRQSESRVMVELANMRTEFHRTLRVHLVAMMALGVAFFAFLRG